ncbi:hypothetical protein ES319_D02G181500v1 [Gossypium barbadense]|uniref:Uncharacterized protein n=2 Tax=Gossypium TaxID=3633 RepID=A0A5J5SEE9_GOSBA|nr:hypothetical protein ES319_D02G181500v1 [Gossypium barbadense]TYG80175.1 hypothetical protein ES288_D02G195400v1 [Gossypium darwinii]
MSHIIGRMHLMQEKMGWVKMHILLKRRLYRLGRMMELKGDKSCTLQCSPALCL